MADLTEEQAAFLRKYVFGKNRDSAEPADKAAATDPSPEEEQRLAQAVQQAQTLIETATAREPETTDTLTDLAATTGGQMTGLEYRLKSAASLARKIYDLADESGRDPSEVAKDIKDVLRYTTLFEPQDYVKGVRDTCRQLIAEGYKKLKFRNTWGNKSGYLGINAVFAAPDGTVFELQFHTPKSFYAKDEGTHDLYEEQRRLPPGSDRHIELQRLQQAVFDTVERPKGAEALT